MSATNQPAARSIAHLGTFDIANYGDLLYPIVLSQLAAERNTTLGIRRYAPTPGDAPLQAGFYTESLRSLFDNGSAPATVVIGGGDILRSDWGTVARHYHRTSQMLYSDLRRSIGTPNLLSYLLRHRISLLDPAAFFADCFRARWLNYPGPGPFLIDCDNVPGSQVLYISCGVPHEFDASERERVKRALECAKFIYLRDEQSADKLRRTGAQVELRVAPDLAVTLSDVFGGETQQTRGQKLLRQFGIVEDRRVLCFQCQPYPGFDPDEITKQLIRYEERSDTSVLLLPTGYCHGDDEFLKEISRQSQGRLKYVNVSSVFDVMAIIAASNLFVGTSLHGNITAFSFGVPHIFGPLPVAKIDGCLEVLRLPAEMRLSSWNELNDKLDFAAGLGADFFLTRAKAAKAEVYQVMNEFFDGMRN